MTDLLKNRPLASPGVTATDIAVVGMSAHLPGSQDLTGYWQNLRNGVESIRPLSREALLEAGESPARMSRSNYVPAASVLEGFETFDAEFFGFSPKEAAILDPQHRQFLEVAIEALENAGHVPEQFKGSIGVWAGCGMGSYFYFNLCSNRALVDETGMFLLRHTGNDKDFLATRVSHVLDLKGPSVNVQTACSTSLVAVHYAAQALLNGECDMALAGGVTIELPHARGYLFQEGEILSPDGHCHAFDHRAQGTVFGSGAGCVVLRRAADAIRDGDHIWAILKATAINNDGAAKAGYLAPSVDGQSACISEALALAGVSSDSVSYVECHGTGTYLGDPIEVAALSDAFRESASGAASPGHCRIGSVKTNIGHLDTAAGVAGLIKVALSLHHRELPPSLGYEAPNPAIDFETSPFRVNDRLTPWEAPVLRAGINSLGVGGTNAHAVLEEAPARAAGEASDWPFQPLILSARSKAALNDQALRLADHLEKNPGLDMADLAFTLKEGRQSHEKRRVLVAGDCASAAALLLGSDPHLVFDHEPLGEDPEVVFMFPGGGAQYAGMARDLYETEPVFADVMDEGLAHLARLRGEDIRALWLPEPGGEAAADEALKRPSLQLPLIMITEFALARLYASWGVEPAALVGHSMGENTAAALAGVMSFQDCIALVALRGQLFDRVPAGGMLSVPLSEEGLAPYWADDLDMASVNGPGLCVVSGPDEALAALQARLAADEIEASRVAINIAAHSRMLEPILQEFGDFLAGLSLQPPQIPIISNRTGRVLSAAEAMDPGYWVAHLRGTVRFQDCLSHLKEVPGRVYMEMGPGRALSSLAGANGIARGALVPALRHPAQKISDDAWLLGSVARLSACGVKADWSQIWGGKRRLRLPLPGYAFQRKPYFIAPAAPAEQAAEEILPERAADLRDWGWKPHWRPKEAGAEAADLADLGEETWLIFEDEAGAATAAAALLRKAGQRVILVAAGDSFAEREGGHYFLPPERGREGYDQLLHHLTARGLSPTRILHCWLLTARETFRPGSNFGQRVLEQGFWSLLFLLQALGEDNLARDLKLVVATNGAARLKDEALPWPAKAMVLGPVLAGARELPGVRLSQLDLELPRPGQGAELLAEALIEEALAPEGAVAAVRAGRRYQRSLRPLPLPEAAPETGPETGPEAGKDHGATTAGPEGSPAILSPGAHVMITGGFGGIGLSIAEDLIRRFGAKITLIARSALPPPLQREAWIARHGQGDPLSRRILALTRLERIAAGAGGAIRLARADVADLYEMQAARDEAAAAFGAPEMVIHAAGVVADGPLLAKPAGEAEEVFAPKLHGTDVLDRLFPDGSLRWLVLFSSSSTWTGPAGQVDYIAANEYLNAFAQGRAGGRTRVLALNWGIWQGVGMAAEALSDRMGRPAAPRLPIRRPILREAGFDAHGNRMFYGRVSTRDWLFDGHRTKAGEALLPGTASLQLAAEAWAEQGESGGFELCDLTFFRALNLAEGEERVIRLRLARSGEGYGFELQSGLGSPGREAWQTHATARLLPLKEAAPAAGIDPAAIAARLGAVETGTGLPSPQEEFLAFGPRWRVLQSRAFGEGEALASLSLPAPFRGEVEEGWLVHPALADLATGWAMELIRGYQPERLWVPLRYGSLRLYAPLSADLISHIRNAAENEAGRPVAVFDITLAKPSGEILAEIKGFIIRRLDGALQFPPPDPRSLESDEPQQKPLSPAEERLVAAFRQGIRPEEGPEAFRRALVSGLPQLIVSSLDMPALIRQTERAANAPARGGQSFERPDLETDYLAPRDDIERSLAGFWQELLGVSQVGVEDDFFALGGHSLIAVRLFAMVKKTWAVDFPISVLFEAPTVAACAGLIREAAGIGPGGEEAGEGRGAEPVSGPGSVARAPRRYKHLVAMHQGEGGAKRPFFLVAGMFGNVLNLRHLAGLLGRDRPFYGLQARGLYGDDAPHESFAAAASDYLAELREVQPNGPYLLGGFSGGGLIAWEMARQIEASGGEVALLTLLDTPLPMRPGLSRPDKALIKLAEFRRKGPAYLGEWLANRRAWSEAQRAGPAAQGAAAFHSLAIEAAFRAALPHHQMSLREGPTVLFRPPLDLHWKVTGGRHVSAAREYVFADNDLTRFAPALKVIEVPGDHDSMVLEPNVRVLASRLKALLQAMEAGESPVLTEAAE